MARDPTLPVELSPEEVVLIRKCVAKIYGPLVTGQMWQTLEVAIESGAARNPARLRDMRYLIYGFVAVLCLAMVAAGHVKKVKAHSWYPPECCSGYDCAPVLVASDPDKLTNGKSRLLLESGRSGSPA
jgi:hypothetical protein